MLKGALILTRAQLAEIREHMAGPMVSYTFTTLNVPLASSTEALGINDAGQIVGEYSSGNHTDGFLFSGGTYASIFAPFGDLSNRVTANGINNQGQIVGQYKDFELNNRNRGFIINDGVYVIVNVGVGTYPTGINNAGEFVGFIL